MTQRIFLFSLRASEFFLREREGEKISQAFGSGASERVSPPLLSPILVVVVELAELATCFRPRKSTLTHPGIRGVGKKLSLLFLDLFPSVLPKGREINLSEPAVRKRGGNFS